MTFEEYLIQVNRDYVDNAPNIRLGQQYMNTLSLLKPALGIYVTTRASHVDPFNDDSRLPEFLEYVARIWNSPWTEFTLEEYALLRWRNSEDEDQRHS